MGIGLTEGILIAAIVIFFFGGKKIPQLGKTLGESIKGFKEGMKSNPTQTQNEAKKDEDVKKS
jgi:sec-independent protein translocase protein TatA